MKIKQILLLICLITLLVVAGIFIGNKNLMLSSTSNSNSGSTITTSVRFVNSTITAEGNVTAQDQATLHFQIAGKLTSLPFKEGDSVKSGQTIASLDSYSIQKQLQAALNTYRTTRDVFDQNVANSQNNYLQAQQTYPYNVFDAAGIGGSTETNVINDMVKRIIDENQANLDNSVIQVQLANNAFQLSTITSPLNGILLHEDVTVSGINVSPTTSFTVADPLTAVFRANVPVNNINYVAVGSSAEIAVDGIPEKITGTVTNIYPSKVTLPTGESVYQVDIQSDQLMKLAKLDQTGTAMIKTNSENVALVPVWTVIGGKYIWIDDNGEPQLKTVTTGKIHGQDIEITGGLTPVDRIIINPRYIPSLKYQML